MGERVGRQSAEQQQWLGTPTASSAQSSLAAAEAAEVVGVCENEKPPASAAVLHSVHPLALLSTWLSLWPPMVSCPCEELPMWICPVATWQQ